MSTFKLALCQFPVVRDKLRNLEKARQSVYSAVGRNAEVIVLPESFNSPYDMDLYPEFAEPIPEANQCVPLSSTTVSFLQSLASSHGVYIVGAIPEVENGKYYNTAIALSPEGDLIAKHRKVHLFDVDIVGGIRFQESSVLSAGDEVTVFDTRFGRFGLGICFDLRFPLMSHLMAKKGARVLLFPAAFNTTTGPLHWDLLLRSRAVDQQVFVAAASPARSAEGYPAWGHSQVVDPWGRIVSTCAEDECIVCCDIDLSQTDLVRAQIPVTSAFRDDLFEVVEKKKKEEGE